LFAPPVRVEARFGGGDDPPRVPAGGAGGVQRIAVPPEVFNVPQVDQQGRAGGPDNGRDRGAGADRVGQLVEVQVRAIALIQDIVGGGGGSVGILVERSRAGVLPAVVAGKLIRFRLHVRGRAEGGDSASPQGSAQGSAGGRAGVDVAIGSPVVGRIM